MFPKANRFSFKKKLPKNVLNSPSFSLRYEKNNEGVKTAVVVSKKIDKRATVRNKIKRIILNELGNYLNLGNLNVVVYVKKPAVNNLLQIGDEIKTALSKIKNA